MALRRGKIKGGRRGVIDSAAPHATQMVVFRRIGVEAGLAAGVFEFLDHSHPSQQVQVAVDRAQAHFRQSSPDKLVEFYRCWVGRNRLQFLENYLPLPRLAAMAFLAPTRQFAGRQQNILSGLRRAPIGHNVSLDDVGRSLSFVGKSRSSDGLVIFITRIITNK